MSDHSRDETSEEKMRRTFEERRGTPFTDEEWEEAKRNLVGLFLAIGLGGVTTSEDEPDDDPSDVS